MSAASASKWQKENPEKALAKANAWRAANLEKAREQERDRYATEPAKYRAKTQNWRANNLDRARASGRKSDAKRWIKLSFRAAKIARRCGHQVEIPTRPIPERCECCSQIPKRGLHLDHNHTTGRFQGWLCNGCNTGGKITDSIELLKLKIAYLERAAERIAAIPDSEVKWIK